MMQAQFSFFEVLTDGAWKRHSTKPPAARRTDPATSHAAARSARALAADHHARILDALRRHGRLGKDGIARATGLSGVAVARRLPELERAGLVTPTGRTVESDTGRQEREWGLA
jgi:DNA-binding transcriptional ArsR family regulator